MNRDLLEEFVGHLEELMEQSNETEYVQDTRGCYSKVKYMRTLIAEARELIMYGELKIALENMLENLNEVSIFIDEETANVARRAFDTQIPVEIETAINLLVKKQ